MAKISYVVLLPPLSGIASYAIIAARLQCEPQLTAPSLQTWCPGRQAQDDPRSPSVRSQPSLDTEVPETFFPSDIFAVELTKL
jgi:hypothetical protein